MQPEQRRSPFLGHELAEQGVEAILLRRVEGVREKVYRECLSRRCFGKIVDTNSRDLKEGLIAGTTALLVRLISHHVAESADHYQVGSLQDKAFYVVSSQTVQWLRAGLSALHLRQFWRQCK